MSVQTVTIAMTGASGAPYTLRLLEICLQAQIQIQFIASQPAQIVLGMESDLKLTGAPQKMQQQLASYFDSDPDQISVYAKDQWTAPAASGSSVADAMVICPLHHGIAGFDSRWYQRKFDSSRRRCDYQGAEKADTGAPRDAVLQHPPLVIAV